jgi:hypothetical protein
MTAIERNYDECQTKPQRTLDETTMDVKRNKMDNHCTYNNVAKQSTSTSCIAMVCKREDFFFPSILFAKKILFVFFLGYYKGYSLHDNKFKNTWECIAQMLTSKPMYKERKCMWGYIT